MIMKIPYHYFNGFINCYVGCNMVKDDGNKIYVAFKTETLKQKGYKNSNKIISNEERINIIKKSSQFSEEIIIGDFTLFVFSPYKNFEKDLDVFRTGKYSQFSLRYKRIIKNTYPNLKKIHSIINPSEQDRKKLSEELLLDYVLPKGTEIYSKPRELEEYFSLAHFIEVEV